MFNKSIYNKVIKISIIILSLLIILTLGRSAFLNYFFNKRETIVPKVTALHIDDAKKLLEDFNLKYSIIEYKSSEVPEDYVFIQDPKPESKVKVNRTVNIWVNKINSVEIPDLKGKTLIEARRILEEFNIQIVRIDYMPVEDIDEEIVLSIYPKVGSKIGTNQKVSLLVSSKSLIESKVMPNLIGLDKNDAANILAQIGQSIALVTEANDPAFAQNVIITTNPLPGENIEKDTKISVVINTGVEVDKSITEVLEQKVESKKLDSNIEEILNKTLKKVEKKEANKENRAKGE
ncbi:PASTA domain-containing protein [Streptobacillus moniliformis]|uniref:PASTA domain-containing protein n=1 Tax=Streptobacillus moniliformis TaxID=34105 RepID=UPI0007E36EBB|nr:PASTA domain-containing protein [Streptobacillus moniliformis]